MLAQFLSIARRTRVDPFTLVGAQLADLRLSLLSLLGSGHPALSETAPYYFTQPSKQIRPVIVLLFAQATNGLGKAWSTKLREAELQSLDTPLTRPDVLNDWNPNFPLLTASFNPVFSLHPPSPSHSPSPRTGTLTTATPPIFLPTQLRFAQIIEMLHTASLLHDDVIDSSPLRRGAPSAPTKYGDKMSVLSGNFILGRASTALARLGDEEVTHLAASVMSDLVDGEILQMREVRLGDEDKTERESKTASMSPSHMEMSKHAWNAYLQKTYLKTASLMAKGARGAVVLGGCTNEEVWRDIAYAYGRNIGIAFQLVDDVLDFESTSSITETKINPSPSSSNNLGKPAGADLQLGLATGPALYAWEEHPDMGPLIQRKFAAPGDVERARTLVLNSQGVHRTKLLARAYADKANNVLHALPSCDAREALEVLAERVVERRS